MEEYLWLSHRLELPGLLHAAKEAAILDMGKKNSLQTLATLHLLAEGPEDVYKEAALEVFRARLEELRGTEAWADFDRRYPDLAKEIKVIKTSS